MKRRSVTGQMLIPILGFGMLGITLILGIVFGEFPTWLLSMGGIAVAVVLFGLFRQQGGSLRDSLASITYSLFALVSAVFLYLIIANHSRTIDLTEHGVYTLSDETTSFLRSLDHPIQITAFARPVDHPRLQDFFELYQRESENLAARVIDPAAEIEVAREYDRTGIYPGEVFVETTDSEDGRRIQRFTLQPTDRYRENVLTNNLLRLQRGGDERIYFTRGKGELAIRKDERRAENEPDVSCSEIADELQRQLMPVADLNLTALTAVPEDAALVIVAGPKVDFSNAEVEMLREYLAEGGSMLLMLDPAARGDFENLIVFAREYGVELPGVIVLDDTPGKNDVSLLPVMDTRKHPVVGSPDGAVLPMKFARPVLPAPEESVLGVQPVPFLVSSPRSWTRHPLEVYAPGGITPPPASDRTPQTVAILADWMPQRQLRRNRAKLAVFGDSDFITNQFLADQAAILFLQTTEWMITRDDRLQIPPRLLPPSSFTLTQVRFWSIIGILSFISLGLLVAGVTWTTARRRMG